MSTAERSCRDCIYVGLSLSVQPCQGCCVNLERPSWVPYRRGAPPLAATASLPPCPSGGDCTLDCYSRLQQFPHSLCSPAKDTADMGQGPRDTATPRPDFTGMTAQQSRPKVLILGHARHGKDTAAELLRDNHGYTFASSSFFAAERVVRPALFACGVTYDTLEECYADRVNRRGFWYEAIAAYNGGGASKLAEAILKDHDVYVGMRAEPEYRASLPLFDRVLWVDASGRGLPPEATGSMSIEYDPDTMTRIDNGGSLAYLAWQLAAFAKE